MKNGSGLAIDEINASGGIAGRKIDRIVIDADVATPEGVTTAFKKLVSAKVDAILVGYIQVDAPSYDIAAAYGAPYIHGNTLDAGVQRVKANPKKYFNIFNVDSTEVHYGTNFPLFLQHLASYRPVQAEGEDDPLHRGRPRLQPEHLAFRTGTRSRRPAGTSSASRRS